MDGSITKEKHKKFNLPRNIILLGWVSFFADISSEMIYPIIPIFLEKVLNSPGIALGLIEGLAQALVSFLAALSGIISDRSKSRVRLVQSGYGFPIFGKAIISIATSWHILLIGRLIDRFGKGLRGSPRDAIIANEIQAEKRGEAFGFHRMMDTTGAFVGVIIAAIALLLLKDKPVEFTCRSIFALSAILASCSLIVSMYVKEQYSEQITNNKKQFIFSGLSKEYWSTITILAIFAFANSSDTFLLLKASQLGLTPLNVVLIYALYNISYALVSYPAGKLSDKYGRWQIISIGWIIYALVYSTIAIANNQTIWFIFAVYGVYMALTEGISKALIVDCVPAEKKGTAIGILYLILGLSALSSNIIAGYLWDSFGNNMPFYLGSTSALIAISMIFILGKIKWSFNRYRDQ